MRVKTYPEILFTVEDDELLAYINAKLYIFENIVSKRKGAYKNTQKSIDFCKQFLNVIEKWMDKYSLFSHLGQRIARVRTFMAKLTRELRTTYE